MTQDNAELIDLVALSTEFPIYYPQSPQWRFRLNELSAGQYLAEGRDCWGHSCTTEGSDPEALLMECYQYALEIGDNEQAA